MRSRSLLAALAVAALCATPGQSQIVPTGPFTGEVSEGFNDQNPFGQACLALPIFGGGAQLCAEAPDLLLLVNNSTGPGSNPCNIADHTFGVGPNGLIVGNADIDGNGDDGQINLTFELPVTRLGGYFAANDSLNSPDQGAPVVRLYDSSGNLILDDTFVLTNDCAWTWNGWEVVSGPPIARAEFRSGTSSRSLTLDDFEADVFDVWTSLAAGLAGTGGQVPALNGIGDLVGDDLVRISLTNALPGATAFLILSPTLLDAPFKQGTLVPNPDVIVALATNGSGNLVFNFTWPDGLPYGVDLYWQYWIADAGGPAGFSASNGLQSTTP